MKKREERVRNIASNGQNWLFEELIPEQNEAVPDNLPHFKNPSNDDERFLNMQYEWLTNHSTSAEASMWFLAEHIARKIIRNEMKLKKFYLPEEDQEDIAGIAVQNLLSRYKKLFVERDSAGKVIYRYSEFYSGFYFKKHFCQILRMYTIQQLYTKKSVDNVLNLDDFLNKELKENEDEI